MALSRPKKKKLLVILIIVILTRGLPNYDNEQDSPDTEQLAANLGLVAPMLEILPSQWDSTQIAIWNTVMAMSDKIEQDPDADVSDEAKDLAGLL